MRMRSAQPVAPGKNSAACPICKRAAAARFRPFCSQRCADLDLGRWLTGGYAIASEEPASTDESADTGETDP
jgi:endogenous inhibitor of DNA gyrase (YacG/DUF329 family)